MVSSYLVTTVSELGELGVLRFRPCNIGGRSALLRGNRCVDVDRNKGLMAGPTTPETTKLSSFVKRYRAFSSANCTSRSNKTGTERLLQVQHWLCACVWTKLLDVLIMTGQFEALGST